MEKLYYSISEVADLLKIEQSTLRFWEKEFPQLRPKTSAKGTRTYTADDISLLQQIVFLKNQNLTLNGIRQKLRDKKDEVAKKQEIAEILTSIKKELTEIAQTL